MSGCDILAISLLIVAGLALTGVLAIVSERSKR